MRKFFVVLGLFLCLCFGLSQGLKAEDPGPLAAAIRQALLHYGLIDSNGDPIAGGGAVATVTETGSALTVNSADPANPVLSAHARVEDVAALGVTADNFVAGNGSNLVLKTASQARTSLALVPGTDVQAYDADLTTLGAGGSSARSFLGLAIGTDVQAFNSNLTTITTSTTGDVLYASGSNTLAKRTIGSTGDVLTVAGGVPTWAAPSATALSHVELDMRDGYAYPSTTSSATLNTRNGHFVLDFEASETSANAALFDDSILFQFTMPEDYAGGDITVSLTVAALTATTGNVMFYMAWEAEPTSYDLDADSFDTVVTFTTTATSGTDGATVRISSTFTPAQLDDVAAGDTVRMLLCRDNNAALDTLAVKAQLVACTITEEP